MNKLEKDGLVAVVISPISGLGWSIEGDDNKEMLCMDADIAQAVIDNDIKKAVFLANQKGANFNEGIRPNLVIKWVPKGSKFLIKEYAGSESLYVYDDKDYMEA